MAPRRPEWNSWEARLRKFVKLYGIAGALAAAVLLGTALLAVIATGLHGWLPEHPSWLWFKVSLSAFVCAILLGIVFLGKEPGWWLIYGETLDRQGLIGIGVTLVVATAVYWQAR